MTFKALQYLSPGITTQCLSILLAYLFVFSGVGQRVLYVDCRRYFSSHSKYFLRSNLFSWTFLLFTNLLYDSRFFGTSFLFVCACLLPITMSKFQSALYYSAPHTNKEDVYRYKVTERDVLSTI